MSSRIVKRKKTIKLFFLAVCLTMTAFIFAACGSNSSVQVEGSVVSESVTTNLNADNLLILDGSYEGGTIYGNPVDLSLKDGALYVADAGNNKIYRYDLSSDKISDILSDVNATALCFSEDRLYFADSEKGTLNYMDGNSCKTAADNLGNVLGGITADEKGNIYVCSGDRHCIYVIDENGSSRVFAGTAGKSGYSDGNVSSALFYEPMDIAYYDGVLYVADSANNVIRAIKDETVSTIAGSVLEKDGVTDKPAGGDSVGDKTLFSYPSGICVYNDTIIVSDTLNNSIKAVKFDGSSALLYGGKDAGLAEGTGENARMNRPMGIIYDGSSLYLADSYNKAIRSAGLNIDSVSYETVHSTAAYASRTVVIYSIDKTEEAENTVTRGAEKIEAYEGMRLTAGDTIATNENGGLYISVDNDRIFRLEKSSSVSITQADERRLTITLLSGDFFFNVQKKLDEDEEMDFIEGSITLGIRGTSGYFSHTENSGNICLSLMLFDGKVSVKTSSINGSKEISDFILPGTTAAITVEGRSTDHFVCEEYDIDSIPDIVKEIIRNDEQLRERIIESISETRGMDKTEIENIINRAVKIYEPETSSLADEMVLPAEQEGPEGFINPIDSAEPRDSENLGNSEDMEEPEKLENPEDSNNSEEHQKEQDDGDLKL